MVDSVLVSDITERVRVRVDACKLSVSKTSAMHQAPCAKKDDKDSYCCPGYSAR